MKEQSSSKGVGFFGLLTIVFIVLKLTKVIDWSWVWVLAPLWISIILLLIFSVIVAVIEVKKESTTMTALKKMEKERQELINKMKK